MARVVYMKVSKNIEHAKVGIKDFFRLFIPFMVSFPFHDNYGVFV